MALSPQQKTKLSLFAGKTLGRYIAYVDRTSTVMSEPADTQAALRAAHPAIVATWHGQFMMLVTQWPKELAVAAMVARHGDAELIGKAVEHYNVHLIRGAGAGLRKRDRGGAQALRAAVKALQSGMSFVMTADVPPGPARRCGMGIILMARLSGRPIVPVAAASSRYRALNTWSRMTINLPFSKMGYVVGSPIFVAPDLDEAGMELKRLEVEASLNAVTQRAYRLAGADARRATPVTRDTAADPGQGGLRLAAYRLGTTMLRPVAPLLLAMRERQGKEDAARRSERFGRATVARPEGPLVWIHAASVGETNAVLPLIHQLHEDRNDLTFLLTTGTVTSAGLAMQRLPARAIHQYVPLDAPQYARAFLEHWRPQLALFTESEIWPNLILETAKRHIPLVLVNGRMSQRSFQRWRNRKTMSRPIFSSFELVLAQNERLARRFGDLGATRVIAAGNLKIDSPPPPADPRERERLLAALGGRPVLVAASTHEGEEALVAEAHRRLARDIAGLCTIIAPRHPERGPGIVEWLKGQGLTVAQRSLGGLPTQTSDIYVADTIGELGTLYSLSQVAFIGGSLIDRGGQNPIEAVRHGTAVVTGPYWYNFRDAYEALLKHHGAVEVRSAQELSANVSRLMLDQTELKRMNVGATAALQVLGGALQTTAEAVAKLLPADPRLVRAS